MVFFSKRSCGHIASNPPTFRILTSVDSERGTIKSVLCVSLFLMYCVGKLFNFSVSVKKQAMGSVWHLLIVYLHCSYMPLVAFIGG